MEQKTGSYSRFKEKYGINTATATGKTGGGWSRFKEKYGVQTRTPTFEQMQSAFDQHTSPKFKLKQFGTEVKEGLAEGLQPVKKVTDKVFAPIGEAFGKVADGFVDFGKAFLKDATTSPMEDYVAHLKASGQEVDPSQLKEGTQEYNDFLDGYYRWLGDRYLGHYEQDKKSAMDEAAAHNWSGVMQNIEKAKENKFSYWSNRMRYSDFARNSGYERKVKGYFTEDQYKHIYSAWPEEKRREYWDQEVSFADALYESINGNYLMFNKLNNDFSAVYANDPLAKNLKWDLIRSASSSTLHLTEAEKKVFNYLFKVEGPEKAIEFLNDMYDTLDARYDQYYTKKTQEWAKEDPFGNSLATVVGAPLRAALGAFGTVTDLIDDGQLEKDAWYRQPSRDTAIIRGAIGDQIRDSWAGNVGGFLYDASMSAGDSAMNTLTMGGLGLPGNAAQWGSSILTGSDAAVTAMDDALNRGLSSGQALTLGLISGLGETVMEKVSLGTILDNKMLDGGVLKNMLKGSAVEGLEEVSTELLNTVADIIISQDKSHWQMAIDAYKQKGLSENEAFWRAVGDKAVELGYNFAAGFAAGGMMSGGNMALHAGQVLENRKDRKALGKKMDIGLTSGQLSTEQIQSMIDEGLAFGKGTYTYTLANRLQNKLNSGKTISGNQLAQLVTQSYTDAAAKEDGPKGITMLQIDTDKTASVPPTANPTPSPSPIDMDELIDSSIASIHNAPADPLSAAMEGFKATGTVTNSQARDILNNTRSIQQLIQQTGIQLPDTASGRRAAVKQAVAQLAQQQTADPIDTAQNTDYDNQNTTGGNTYGNTETAGFVYSGGIQRNAQGNPSGETARSQEGGSRHEGAGSEGRTFPEGSGGNVYTTDSEGRTLTQEQSASLQGTSVIDSNGAPLAVYHSTDNMDFDTFEKGDTGFHFGSASQAATHSQKRGYTAGRTFRAYLNIKNPVHARYDIMGWRANGTALYLWGDGVLTDAELQQVMDLWQYGSGYNDPAAVRLREIVESKGYDGIVYPNGFEGEGNSYIAFHDNQIIRSETTTFGNSESTSPTSVGAALADFTGKQEFNDLLSDENAQPAAPEGAVGESAAADMVAPEAMDADGGLVPGAAWMKSSTEDAVRNESNNGGNLYDGNTGLLYGEQGRVPGSGAIGQTGSVANGSAGTGRSVDQRRTAAERQNLVNAQNIPAISTAELGVTKGTNEKTVRVMPEELWDDAQRTTAQRIQEKTGKQVTFVVGGLLINGPDGPAMANGVWTKNGIVIRADHLRYTIDQIADHEIFHDAAFRTPGLVMSIEAEIREKFGDEALDAVVEQYIKALRGIAGIPDGATQEQIDAIAFEILEEIWADAYAGVNRFGAGANQFQNEVTQLSERVAPMQSVKQDNSVEQPTGPPTDKFSIEEIQGENGVYGQGVVLDTTLFDGLKPRQWGEVLSNYVYSNLAGSQITVYDEFNQPETIHFAKVNDRVKKDGAKNSHKVIDKLARYRGDNVSALGIVHIDELLQTSRYDKSTDEHKHQWMDENGWELRKTYIQEGDGTIYEATLNIANGRDRRILYAISNVRQIDKGGVARGDVPSTVSGRGSLTKSNSSNETIADSEQDVKQRFSMDDAVGEEHLRPEDLKDVPMYQPKHKSPYRADSERAVDTRLVSDAEAHAAAVKGAIFRNMSKEDFDGTDALKKLGVKVDNSVGIYSMVKSMIANDRSAKAVIKALRKAQVRLGATPGERNYASGIADGIYSSSNIPGDMDADKVMELADYYWAVKAITSDQITKQRDSIRQTLQDKIERIMRRVDTTKIKPPRAFTLHHRTAGRNMVSIFGPEIGKQLNAFLFDPVAVNEAERYRFVNRMHDTVRKFTGKDGKSKKLNKMERALVQQVIEGRAVEETVAGMEMRHAIKNAAHNIRNGEDAGDAAREFSLTTEERRLAEQYSRWLQTQDALKNDKVDEVRVDNAVRKYSEMFGLFYDAINDFLVAHGYEPIGFIKGYVPHLQPEANQNALSKALEKMGLSKDVSNLPTNIAGLTKNFKPNKRFNPYFLSRHGDVTQYDIVTAFESYVDYMSDVLYHTDDIMRVRQASQYFRKTFAPEENRNLIEQALELRYGTVESKLEFLRENGEISMFSYLSAEDVNITLDKYLDRLFGNLNDKTVYSDFVMWLDDYANKLAGKQLMTDRDLERTMGRTSLNWVSRLARAFSRAQIAGNLSSALNQTAQLPQVIGENGIKNTAEAVRDFAFCRLKRAGWRQESDFLTEKEGIHYIANTKMDMVVEAAFKPLQWYDGFISTIAVRSKYLKEIQNGASHSEAMKSADKFGRNVMGSRAKGTIPLAFQSKGIVSQFFHLFQVEAANSWEHIVVDLPQDFKEIQKSHGTKAAAGSLAGVIVKTLIAAFLLNRIDEELYGGTPAPYDLLGLTANFIASGQELSTNEFLNTLMDNCWESVTGDRIFDTDDDSLHDGKFNWGGAFEDTLYNVTNDIPYLRNAAALLGLGDETLPIPDLAGSAKDIVDAISDEGLISYDMGQALLGIAGDILPGGRQIEKTVAGIETAIRGGKYKGTGDNSKLQYPVDVDPWTALRLALFGDAAASERNQFYASGDSALSEKQTSVYQSLVNQGADSKELYAAIQDYREVSNDDSLSSVERGKQCRDIIRSLDMSDELKLEMYEGMTGAKSTVESFRILMDAGLGWNDVMDVYDKYSELKANKELRPQDQAGIFAKWVDQQKYSSNQRASIKEQLLFWNMYPAQAAQYEEFVELGLSTDDAYELAEQLDNLEPETGTDKVTDVQRWRACVEFSYKPGTQLAALAGVMDDAQLLKARVAYEMDVNPDTYVTLKERLPEYDLNHDGSMTNAEVKAAVDSMTGLSYKQKAVLWQLNVNSKSAKNNPYSTVVGQQVLDAKNEG